MGRLNHYMMAAQASADPEMLEEAKKVYPLVHVEMQPGDALFFSSNLLHCSAQNRSDMRRWAFIVSYNKKSNNPTKKHHHAQYHPLGILPNSAIMECNIFDSTVDKWYMDPKEDDSWRMMPKWQIEK